MSPSVLAVESNVSIVSPTIPITLNSAGIDPYLTTELAVPYNYTPNLLAIDVGFNTLEVKDHPVLTYGYLTVLCLTTLVGNVGNTMVIGAVVCDRRLRKESNIFIVNLAVADFCVTGFVDIFSIVGVFVDRSFWEVHSGLCHVVGSICLVSCVCSLWSITAISINRYVLLCRQALYYRIFSWRNSYIICGLLWVGAFLLDLPNFLGWGDHTYDMKTMACSYDRLASYSYTVFFITMFVTIPLFTVLYCNVNIYMIFLRSKKRVAAHTATKGVNLSDIPPDNVVEDEGTSADVTEVGNESSTNNSDVAKKTKKIGRKQISKEMKLAKTLFIVFIVFCVAWSPYALLCLIDKHDTIMKEAYAVSILFAHGSSSLNSILYGATNKSFRDGYRLFLSKLHINI